MNGENDVFAGEVAGRMWNETMTYSRYQRRRGIRKKGDACWSIIIPLLRRGESHRQTLHTTDFKVKSLIHGKDKASVGRSVLK